MTIITQEIFRATKSFEIREETREESVARKAKLQGFGTAVEVEVKLNKVNFIDLVRAMKSEEENVIEISNANLLRRNRVLSGIVHHVMIAIRDKKIITITIGGIDYPINGKNLSLILRAENKSGIFSSRELLELKRRYLVCDI